MVGNEGVGKGTLISHLCAGLSKGTLPGSLFGRAAAFAIIGDEDSWNNVWTPRLYVAGAEIDPAKELAWNPVLEDGKSLNVADPEHLAVLSDFIEDKQIELVYFDQILDNIGYADSWKDKDVRDALQALRQAADRLGCAFLCAMHPNKKSADAGGFRQLVSGTPAFNALSRSSLYVCEHPVIPHRVVVTRPKGNYTKRPPAFEFVIEPVAFDNKEKRGRRTVTHKIETSKVSQTRESDWTFEDVTDHRRRSVEGSGMAQARAALIALFNEDGRPKPYKDVEAKINGSGAGFTQQQISKAAEAIGLEKWDEGFPAKGWYGWQKPPKKLKVKTNAKGSKK